MKLAILSVLALAGLAAASPKAHHKKAKCGTKKIIASYDDQSYTELLPVLNPIDVYKGLSYTGIDGADTTLFGLDVQALKPHTPPNVATFGVLNDLTQNPPQLTVVYPGSKSKYVNLHSFYFACYADTLESVLNIAQPRCTLTVDGYRGGVKVASKSFEYVSQLLSLRNTMRKATFEKGTWCNLDTIKFSATSTIPILNAVSIDSVDYTLLDKNCYPTLKN